MNTECRKVRALLSLYMDDALSIKLKMFVYRHIKKCKSCMGFYRGFSKTMKYIRSNFKKADIPLQENLVFDVVEYAQFKENISAYFDGELTGLSTLKFENYMERFPCMRQYYTQTINFNKILKKYFLEKSPILQKDLSKKILSKIKYKRYYADKTFVKAAIAAIITMFIFSGMFFLEKFIMHNNNLADNIKSEKNKIKESILKVNFKNLMY